MWSKRILKSLIHANWFSILIYSHLNGWNIHSAPVQTACVCVCVHICSEFSYYYKLQIILIWTTSVYEMLRMAGYAYALYPIDIRSECTMRERCIWCYYMDRSHHIAHQPNGINSIMINNRNDKHTHINGVDYYSSGMLTDKDTFRPHYSKSLSLHLIHYSKSKPTNKWTIHCVHAGVILCDACMVGMCLHLHEHEYIWTLYGMARARAWGMSSLNAMPFSHLRAISDASLHKITLSLYIVPRINKKCSTHTTHDYTIHIHIHNYKYYTSHIRCTMMWNSREIKLYNEYTTPLQAYPHTHTHARHTAQHKTIHNGTSFDVQVLFFHVRMFPSNADKCIEIKLTLP